MVEAGYHTARSRSTFRGAYGTRAFALIALRRLLAKHFVGEETILESGDYKRTPTASAIICRAKTTQSGDLSELLAIGWYKTVGENPRRDGPGTSGFSLTRPQCLSLP